MVESIEECLVRESSSPGDFPREYGPEFNSGLGGGGCGYIDLEECDLPHIDPRLTVRLAHQPHDTFAPQYAAEYAAQYTPVYSRPAEYEPAKWEPLITKVYNEYTYGDNALSLMNTDIF